MPENEPVPDTQELIQILDSQNPIAEVDKNLRNEYGNNKSREEDSFSSGNSLSPDFYKLSEDESIPVPEINTESLKQCKSSEEKCRTIETAIKDTQDLIQILESQDSLASIDVEPLLDKIISENLPTPKKKHKSSETIEVLSSSSENENVSDSNEEEIQRPNSLRKCTEYLENCPITESQLSNPPIDELPEIYQRSQPIEICDTDSSSSSSSTVVHPPKKVQKRKPFLKKKIFTKREDSPELPPINSTPEPIAAAAKPVIFVSSQRDLPKQRRDKTLGFADILAMDTKWVRILHNLNIIILRLNF